ncbi:superinfection immunity protein [Pseudomonas sp. Ps21-P2]|uniref:superinfection immunity protein n=1 Tax=Pseudomonas sp. Ps21-P2 TaxID=3080331 RepID=UPI00320A901F
MKFLTVVASCSYRQRVVVVVIEQGVQMFVIRFLVLGFLAFYSYAMGDQPGGLNGFGTFIAFSGIVVIPAFYMLPTIEAWLRESSNLPSIAAVNLFLGWSIIGWVFALIWAFRKPTPIERAQQFGYQLSQPSFPSQQPDGNKPKKDCPFCGEEILAVAKKCKHCGSELTT